MSLANLFKNWSRSKSVWLIFSLLGSLIFKSIITSFLLNLDIFKGYGDIAYFEKENELIISFFTAVLVAPILETFLFQFLVIEGYVWLLGRRYNAVASSTVLSAFIFGLVHDYNVFTIINGIVSGILFASFYWVFRFKERRAFIYIMFVHGCYNLYVFLIRDVFHISF